MKQMSYFEDVAGVTSLTAEERGAYEANLKTYYDNKCIIEEIVEETRKESLAEGRAEGREMERALLVESMKENGFSKDQIIKLLKLTPEEVSKYF